jgi:protein TonB
MFEDSTFESNGRIQTRSRAWMFATCAFNGSILLAMVLVPLIYPSALPHMVKSFLMEAPAPPQPQPKPITEVAIVTNMPSQFRDGRIIAPSLIPRTPFIPATPEVARPVNVASADFGDKPDGNDVFGSHARQPEVHPAGPVRISGMVVAGLLIHQTKPAYPPIAIASRTEGTVVLQATISRTGTIENLHVISGPVMLRQAALNAVRDWQYRPYLLNSEPVEVVTTVNVIFKLN